MISHHHKAIFIHIPKCGGQSVETMFLDDLGLDWKTRAPLLLRHNDEPRLGPPALAHLTALEYAKYKYVTPAHWQEYFVFTVVRDPYARVVSLFNYLKHDHDLATFVDDWLPAQFALRDSYAAPVHDYAGQYHFVRPQVEFVMSEDGRSMMDRTFRLERPDRIEKRLRKRFSLSAPLRHVNRPRAQRAVRGDLAPRQIATINRLYAPDFEAFGYAMMT